MTTTITAVTDSRVASNPENTLAKSATYPAGPVTDTPSPPVSAWRWTAAPRPVGELLPAVASSATRIGTTTCRARPSVAGTGPMTFPVTSLTPANRLASAAALAWSAGVTGQSGRS
jgi:hypothetical protein